MILVPLNERNVKKALLLLMVELHKLHGADRFTFSEQQALEVECDLSLALSAAPGAADDGTELYELRIVRVPKQGDFLP